MKHYPFYTPTDAQIDELLTDCRMGRLITVHDGIDVGIYPYVAVAQGCIEIHLNKTDAQVAALRANPQCVFQVDDVLADIPSHWIHPEQATFGDALYRFVAIHGVADVTDDSARIAEHVERIVQRHQGGGHHVTVSADAEIYRNSLARLVMVRIEPQRRIAKFKLGQQEPEEVRRRIVQRLDERSARLVERTLD